MLFMSWHGLACAVMKCRDIISTSFGLFDYAAPDYDLQKLSHGENNSVTYPSHIFKQSAKECFSIVYVKVLLYHTRDVILKVQDCMASCNSDLRANNERAPDKN